jgi:uncharacterized delta-60 repeat protein
MRSRKASVRRPQSRDPIIAGLELLESRRLCHTGDLDTSFSGDGIATISPGGNFVVASMDTRGGRTVALGGTGQSQPGAVTGGASIVAFNSSGQLDTTFSGDGKRPLPRLTDPRDIFIQSDGKILVVGKVDGVAGIARLLPNGAPDTSFSGDGFATIGLMKQLTGVRIAGSGKIVVSGISNGAARFAAARFNVDGTLDTSFSGDGVAITSQTGIANAVAVQTDGKVVLVGTTLDADQISNIAVVRLGTGGSYDTGFSGDGRTIFDYGTGDDGTSVDLTPSGRILVGARLGTSSAGALVLTTGGALNMAIDVERGDTGFGTPRVNNIRSSFDGNQIYLFVDRYNVQSLASSDIVRFNSDGTRDNTFGNAGLIQSQGEGHGDLQADGKIVAAGNISGSFTSVRATRRISAIDSTDRIGVNEDIYVEGTNGDDTITVTRDPQTNRLVVNLNGMTRTLSTDDLSRVVIHGNKGNDVIDTTKAIFSAYVVGGDGDDTIRTGGAFDIIHGGNGNDNISSGGGNDEVWGDAGDDLLNGGDGNDTLFGGLGKDRLYGSAGNDKLAGMQPTKFDNVADYLDGGTGTDTVYQKENVDATNGVEQFV